MSGRTPEGANGGWRRTGTILGIVVSIASALCIVYGFHITHADPDHDLSLAYATWALTAFTFVLAVGIPVTIWFSTKEHKQSSLQFLEQEQDQFYAQLDATYLEIQKLIIEYPHLGDPAALREDPSTTPDQRTQYDAFAFIVWNFIESIHDFTRKDDSIVAQRRSEKLSETWHCILEYEGIRHAAWFFENQRKFKESFCKYIAEQHIAWTKTPAAAVRRRGFLAPEGGAISAETA